MGDKLDPEDPSTLANATELDNMTLDAYCNKYLPGNLAALSKSLLKSRISPKEVS